MTRTAVAVALFAAAASVLLLFSGISTFPGIGNDEWWFTSRFDRGVTYGDWSDTVAFDEYQGNREHPKFPPANAPLRMLVHAVTGIGAALDRYLSAAEFVVVGVIFGLLARRLGASATLAALSLPLLILVPPVFFAARTMRFEQDIFFLGACAVMLASWPGHGRTVDAARAGLSGFAAGMAASMHVFGIAFGGGIIAGHAVRLLINRTSRPPHREALIWLLAAAIPVVASITYFAADLPSTLAYYEGNTRFEAAHLPQRLANVTNAFPALVEGMPSRLHVSINALRIAHRPYDVGTFAATLSDTLALLWAAGFAAIAVGAPLRALRLTTTSGNAGWPLATALLASWAATCLTLIIFILRPHADYAVYPAGLTAVTLHLLVATAPTGATCTAGHWRIARATGGLLLVALMGLGAACLLPLVADPQQHLGGPQAAQIHGMRLLSERAGLEPATPNRPPIYADTNSWAASGARFVPLYEYLIAEVVGPRPAYDAVVVKYEWYQSFVARIPTFTGDPIDVDRRRARLERLLDGLSFAGALQHEYVINRASQTRVWFVREPTSAPEFVRVAPDGQISAARGVLVLDITDDGPDRGSGVVAPLAVPTGFYVAHATATGLSSLRIAVHDDEKVIAHGLPSSTVPQSQIGALVWFRIDEDGGSRRLVVDTVGERGPVRLRVWATPWETARP